MVSRFQAILFVTHFIYRFDAVGPQIFRPGDFIEVQLSIIAVAMKNCRMQRGRLVLMS